MCQIYKYHYCEDIVLDTDFLPRLVLLPFIMSGSPATTFTWLGFCLWAICLPRLYFWRTKQVPISYHSYWAWKFPSRVIPEEVCLRALAVEGRAQDSVLEPASSSTLPLVHQVTPEVHSFNGQAQESPETSQAPLTPVKMQWPVKH